MPYFATPIIPALFSNSIAEVLLYYCKIPSTPPTIENWQQLLENTTLTSDEKQQLINHLPSNHKRLSEYFAGRLTASTALATLTGIKSLPIKHSTQSYLIWPVGTCGSISHSNQLAISAVATDTDYLNIGLDIEKPLSINRAERLSRGILTNNELALCSELNKSQRALFISQIFSIKEALFKALNPLTDVFFGFMDAEVENLHLTHIKLNKTLSAHHTQGSKYPIHCSFFEGFVISLIPVHRAE